MCTFRYFWLPMAHKTLDTKAGYLLQKMQKIGILRKEGRFKETRYLLP